MAWVTKESFVAFAMRRLDRSESEQEEEGYSDEDESIFRRLAMGHQYAIRVFVQNDFDHTDLLEFYS